MRRVLLISLAIVAASQAFGQVSYSSNFDPALYTVGGLATQDGWVAGSGTINVPTVTNNVSLSSPQSVMLNGFITGGSSFFSVAHPLAAGAPAGGLTTLTASASIWVDSLALGTDRYFGIAFSTATTATSGFLGIALGGTGLRGNGGSYSSYNSNATGLLQSRDVADFLQRWVGMSIVADRSTTVNNVTFTFTNLGTSGGNATESFTKSVNFGTTNLADIQVMSDWDAGSGNPGTAFIDNASFAAVPEPASMVALSIGALALLRRRKKA